MKKTGELYKKITSFWLFGKDSKTLTGGKKVICTLFNLLLVLMSSVITAFCSLRLAYGTAYPHGIFDGYLKNWYILSLNILPVVLLVLFFYGITSRGWLAHLLGGFLTLGFSLANFYLLRFRDDPLIFSDVLYIKEAVGISKEGYDYTPSRRLILVGAIYIVTAIVLFVFQKQRHRLVPRVIFTLLPVVCIFPLKNVYKDTHIYDIKTQNYDCINRWSATQVYISKGFVYPFIHSVFDAFGQPPADYSEDEARQLLDGFETKMPDEEKKVNVIAIMLEAFCDLENTGIEGINPNVYASYRKIRDENKSGTLITNIFAGGTVDSERAFLTGYADLDNYRHDVNSYVRFFNDMGYYTTGSHPSQDWFYNRKNVNKYLGFSDYLFSENYFLEKYGDNMRLDSVAFPEFYQSYLKGIGGDKPYFAFHVTYQGHGPYSTSGYEWGNGTYYHNENLPETDNYIIDNYLGSVRDTGYQLQWFVDKIQESEEPCVVLLFGDHKPWLGDSNSVYNNLGINLDVSTEQGFRNYYGTEYVIVANSKAKEVLGNDFIGKAPTTSPCMLMSVLCDELGIEGDSFMQYQRTVREKLPALNLVGSYDSEGNYYTLGTMPAPLAEVYNQYMRVAYYRSTVLEK